MGKKIQEYQDKVSKNYFLLKRMGDLGITNEYIGYYYLVDIMDMLINEAKTYRSFSKELFPYLAKKYNKNQCTIERDIRNLRDKRWNRGLKNKLSKFWNNEKKPSCCKFIYLVKNFVLDDIS